MTDETFRIIEAEILLSIAGILKRHGVKHYPPHTSARIHGIPVSQMPPLSSLMVRELTGRSSIDSRSRQYLEASLGAFGLALFSEDVK